jgi:hypothetical protein
MIVNKEFGIVEWILNDIFVPLDNKIYTGKTLWEIWNLWENITVRKYDVIDWILE